MAFGDPIYPDSTSRERQLSETRPFFTDRAFDLRQLPYTRAEVIWHSEFFTGWRAPGCSSGQRRMKEESRPKMDGYRICFCHSHGMIDEENPARSGVILSWAATRRKTACLQVTEIMRLSCRPILVTLSACRTGLGKSYRRRSAGTDASVSVRQAPVVWCESVERERHCYRPVDERFLSELKRGMSKDEAACGKPKLELPMASTAPGASLLLAPFVLVGAKQLIRPVAQSLLFRSIVTKFPQHRTNCVSQTRFGLCPISCVAKNQTEARAGVRRLDLSQRARHHLEDRHQAIDYGFQRVSIRGPNLTLTKSRAKFGRAD